MRESSFIAPPPPEDSLSFGEATLWAGDLLVETEPVRMSTVLGSCVSVCLYDPVRRFGGMNHFLVPKGGRLAIHGDWAMPQLIRGLYDLGCRPQDLEAKVFGGGSPLRLANDEYAVGTANVSVARRVLAEHRIPIMAECTAHSGGLRLFFENWSGTVWVRMHAHNGL